MALLQDSKKLSQAQRERAFDALLSESSGVRWAAAAASPREIDRENILQASLRAMATAVARLGSADASAPVGSPDQVLRPEWIAQLYGQPDFAHFTGSEYAVLVDGPHVPSDLAKVAKTEGVIGGDGKCASIAAASIIAKVGTVMRTVRVVDCARLRISLISEPLFPPHPAGSDPLRYGCITVRERARKKKKS